MHLRRDPVITNPDKPNSRLKLIFGLSQVIRYNGVNVYAIDSNLNIIPWCRWQLRRNWQKFLAPHSV